PAAAKGHRRLDPEDFARISRWPVDPVPDRVLHPRTGGPVAPERTPRATGRRLFRSTQRLSRKPYALPPVLLGPDKRSPDAQRDSPVPPGRSDPRPARCSVELSQTVGTVRAHYPPTWIGNRDGQSTAAPCRLARAGNGLSALCRRGARYPSTSIG